MARAAPETYSLRESRILTLPRTRAEQRAYLLRAAIVAGLYVVSANAGLSLSVAHGSATPVWAPTGISLAALLVFGTELWPAVAAGAFIANVTTPIPLGAAAGIAMGNTAEALVGCLLLRAAGFRTSLERVRDVIALVGLAAVASTTLSATIGVTTSLIAGTVTGATYWSHWVIWWIGDMMGDLLIAPFLLVWIGGWRARPSRPEPGSARPQRAQNGELGVRVHGRSLGLRVPVVPTPLMGGAPLLRIRGHPGHGDRRRLRARAAVGRLGADGAREVDRGRGGLPGAHRDRRGLAPGPGDDDVRARPSRGDRGGASATGGADPARARARAPGGRPPHGAGRAEDHVPARGLARPPDSARVDPGDRQDAGA